MERSTPSILIVDDEVDACRNLADIFTDLGYRVDTAHDGPAALERVRQRRYDVALLDLMMPGMDGLALYREIKKVRAGTVALLVTAYPGNPRADEARSAGVWRVVSKPVDFPRLMALVDEAAGQPLVLVVDDDADLCLNLWDLLRERGYRVCLAHDVRTAVERLRDHTFQAVLLDLRLPDGSGTVVLRDVRRVNPQARVLVVTGCGAEMEPDVRRLLAGDAQGVFPKPIDVPELLATLAKVVPGREEGAATRESPRG